MGAIISTFPVLNKALLGKFRYITNGDYAFSYNDAAAEVKLRTEQTGEGSRTWKIIDETGMWDPDQYNIRIKREYSFQNYGCLFGKNGIACKSAVLGVAVIWTSLDSKQRGAIRVGELRSDGAPQTFYLNYAFNVAQLRGTVELRTMLFISQAGTPGLEERHLANNYGCLLGELEDYFQFEMDGIGSAFPIYEVDRPGDPLWIVSCDWVDPTVDLFSDTVSINLNRAHRNYKYIDRKSSRFDPQLLSEIMASALTVILARLKESPDDWNAALQGDNLSHGSVCEAVNYFSNTLAFDVASPEGMAVSIRRYLDKEVQI